MSDEYPRIILKKLIDIDRLIGVSYRTLEDDFEDIPESHDFWELVYVDSGELDIIEDGKTYLLKSGSLYLHRPNISHMIAKRNDIPVRFVIATFECYSPSIDVFTEFRFDLNNSCKNIMTNLIHELHHAHNVRINNNIYIATPFKEADVDTEALQCIQIYLELLFITLYRLNKSKETKNTYNEENAYAPICNNVIVYLKENIYGKISLEGLCNDLGCGKTMICTHFKNYTGMSIMEYYLNLKIEEAKILLSGGKHNVSQISDMLMFSSPYYFSACFKRICGMSPTKYQNNRFI